MKNLIIIILQFIIISPLAAQLGIGTQNPDESTVLDVVAEDKGIILPNVALLSRTDNQTVSNLIDGIMVYNTTTLNGNENTSLSPGVYYWLTNRWVPQKKGEYIQVTTNGELRTYLGYDPNQSRNPAAFTLGGVTFAQGGSQANGFGCKQWTGNGHWYCAFRGNTGFDWQTAFNAAKSRGGYLATFTSSEEWNWVKTNIIANSTGYNLTNAIWIGYNKVNFSGNATEFTWITGEKSKVNWSNSTSTEHYFNSDEPNNNGGNEGCVHIINSANNTDRRWNDIECGFSNSGWSSPFQDLIIEFNQ
jgi:hypothetical protein